MTHIQKRICHCLYALCLFGIGYSLMNFYTNHLNKYNAISSILFSIDYHTPFIAPMIVFYALSMVWFIGSFFIVSINELPRLTQKIILSVLIACLVFYYFPLQFSFVRNEFNYFIDWQPFYDILNVIDKPFNQSPSLHIIFSILIAYVLKNKLSTYPIIWQILFYALSFLIAISTLFTWQHHWIDVITGVICALFVIVIEHQLNKSYHQKIAQSIIKYLTIAVVVFLILVTAPTLLHLSDMVVLIIKGLAYYWLFSFLLLSLLYLNQNSIRHKTLSLFFNKNKKGQLSCLSYLLFMPLIGIYRIMLKMALNYQFWQIQKTPICFNVNHQKIDMIATGKPTNHILKNIASNYDKVICVDMSVELSSPSFCQNIDYLYCPMLDLMPLDNTQYDRILDYMTTIQQLIKQNANQRLLIICQCIMGRSRSVAMMGCILAYFNAYTMDNILSILNTHCPNHLATPYLDKSVIHRLANKGQDKG